MTTYVYEVVVQSIERGEVQSTKTLMIVGESMLDAAEYSTRFETEMTVTTLLPLDATTTTNRVVAIKELGEFA